MPLWEVSGHHSIYLRRDLIQIRIGRETDDPVQVLLHGILAEIRQLRADFHQQREIDDARWERLWPTVVSESSKGDIQLPMDLIHPLTDLRISSSHGGQTKKRQASVELDGCERKRLRFSTAPTPPEKA
jgi:hypothetical protein